MHFPSLAEIRSRKTNSRNKMDGFVSTHIGGCLYIFHDMLRNIKNGLILLIYNYTAYCQQKNDCQTRFFYIVLGYSMSYTVGPMFCAHGHTD